MVAMVAMVGCFVICNRALHTNREPRVRECLMPGLISIADQALCKVPALKPIGHNKLPILKVNG